MGGVLPAVRELFGRETKIDLLGGYMLGSAPKPSVVLGAEGMGKSALTIAALRNRRVASRFGPHRYFVRLDSSRSAAEMIATVAAALTVHSASDLKSALFTKLNYAPLLLVLDNFDTPWESDREGAEAFLEDLLQAAPLTSLCVSIRGADYPSNIRWNMPIQAQPLGNADSRRAFVSIAGPQFESDRHLYELLHDIDGVPLAVELLALRAVDEPNLESIAAIWKSERANLVAKGKPDDRTLGVAVASKLAIDNPRVGEQARRLLSLLAGVPGGIALQDVPLVLGASPDEAESAINSACETGLAMDEIGRLRVHSSASEFIRANYPPSESDMRRAAGCYLDLAQLGLQIGTEAVLEAVDRLTPEAGNIASVIESELNQSDPRRAIEAASSLVEFYSLTGQGSIGLLDTAAKRALEFGDPVLSAGMHLQAGEIALQRSDHTAAWSSFEQALELYRSADEIEGAANCIARLGDIALVRHDHTLAKKSYDEALALHRSVGSVKGEATCVKSLGDIALERRDDESARRSYEAALPLYRRIGDLLGEANCIKGIGNIALRRRDLQAARMSYEEALPLYREVGDTLGEANCIMGIGDIARRRREHEIAWKSYDQALPLFRQVGSVLGEANCIQSLGDIAHQRRDHNSARKAYNDALAQYVRIGDAYSIGVVHWKLSRVAGEGPEHLADARDAWISIGRQDLIDEYLDAPGAPD